MRKSRVRGIERKKSRAWKVSLNVPSYSLIERDREKRFLGIGAGVSEAQVQASLKTLL